MVNIEAKIEPGVSCAGFVLGQSLSTFQQEVHPAEVKNWSRADGIQLAICIRQVEKWLRVPVSEISEGRHRGEIWYYSGGIIELHFSQSGYLFNISVFDGYQGRLMDFIYLGMPFLELKEKCELVYDESEEIYIPQKNDALMGIGFYIDESNNIPSVHGISISNFELDR